MPRYRAFGLVLACDVPLPALSAADESDAADVVISLNLREPWPDTQGAGIPLHESGASETDAVFSVTEVPEFGFRFAYSDGVEFLVAADGARIRGRWASSMSLEDASEYLYGPIMAFVLRQRGTVCLHAAAIAAETGCFAVLAPAGHGKSTTAAAAARRGLGILTEDLMALDPKGDACLAVPSYPRVRLWPDAAAGVFGDADALPRITPDNDDWDKRYLDLSADGYSFQSHPMPLRVIYTHERSENPTPSFETLPASEALVALLANVYTRWQPQPHQRAEEFDHLRRLAQAVPVKCYRGPYGLEHVGSNVEALLEDCVSTTRIVATNGS